MTTPGIEVRALRQSTGAAHFNEVFVNDVRVSQENVLGAVG
jgi:alkylation response protein AidB-like acyl-CoA dehydrogenase